MPPGYRRFRFSLYFGRLGSRRNKLSTSASEYYMPRLGIDVDTTVVHSLSRGADEDISALATDTMMGAPRDALVEATHTLHL